MATTGIDTEIGKPVARKEQMLRYYLFIEDESNGHPLK